jgi:hypothetical protein
MLKAEYYTDADREFTPDGTEIGYVHRGRMSSAGMH